ncbi:MAG: 3-phosphoshikimate 1-carboxyvinyltransferase [Chloroflexi bacterium]|nr:3-phosphoshikimate 1-carboxyvinyltransferase [Chloroflexota bacterium]
MSRSVQRPSRLRGTVRVPGDKSISHRAALLGALAEGTTHVSRFLASDDCLATLDAMRALGVNWRLQEEAPGIATLEIDGVGLHGLTEPDNVIDVRNSGTTGRLLSGILAGQPFHSVLTGDEMLRARPFGRVVKPLSEMGARLSGRQDNSLLPLSIKGGSLHGIRYRMPVASAQVKSAVLLAGLFADGETVVEEPLATRDHTERLLRTMGVDLKREGPGIKLQPPEALAPLELDVPGDISTAAFWLVAAAAHPDAEIDLPKVGINPTRTGILDVLSMMGAEIDIGEERMVGEEPVADLHVRSSALHGVEIGGELVLRSMDELPAIAVAASFAQGRTVVRDAEELRVKETDRIAALTSQLRKLGVAIEEQPDGFVIEGGGALRGGNVSGGGDHRLTMSLAIAGLLADGETAIEDEESVAISYPGFWEELDSLAT